MYCTAHDGWDHPLGGNRFFLGQGNGNNIWVMYKGLGWIQRMNGWLERNCDWCYIFAFGRRTSLAYYVAVTPS